MNQSLDSIPGVLYRAKIKLREEGAHIEEFEFLNSWLKKLLGWDPEGLKDPLSWWKENIHPEDREKLLKAYEKALKEGEAGKIAYRFRKKDRSYAFILDVFVPSEVADGPYTEITGIWEDISGQGEYCEIFEAIENAPSVGIVIYQDKVVYANRAAIDTFRYPREELYKKSVLELIAPDYRQAIKKIVQRRLKGEQFTRVYEELPVLDREGNVRLVHVFTKTIQWKGKPAGFVIFIDITKQKRYERMFQILREVNQLMITSYDENELITKVCELLVNKAGFKMSWVGVPDTENNRVVPLKVCGEDKGYVSTIRISLDPNTPGGRGPTATAVREKRIVVYPDVRKNPRMKPWAEEMLKRGFISSCAIPVLVGNRVEFVINIYSPFPQMFGEEELSLLEEIQQDISFAVGRIRKDRFVKLINTAIEKGHEWVIITDSEGTILYVNKAVKELSGYSEDELIGKTPRIFKSGYHSKEFYRELWNTIKSGETFEATFINKRKDGKLFYLEQTITPVNIGENRVLFVGFGRDVTSEKYLEEQVIRLRYTDSLTGLPNREGFLTTVEVVLSRSRDREHAFFLIDILDFSGINEVFGTKVGDEILKKTAYLLKKVLFERDIVGRIGGDEFAVLAKGVPRSELTTIVDKLFSIFSKPFEVGNKKIKININVGASLYPKDATTARGLLEKASTALAFAKREGENTYRFFSKEITEAVSEYFHMRDKLETALQEDRFILYFQPISDTFSEKVVGCETLLRLLDEEGKVVPPKNFISILEKTELIGKVENRLLEKLGNFMLKLELRGGIFVTFNISPKSFKDLHFLKKLLEMEKIFGGRLVLEITERLFVENPKYAIEFLNKVRRKGIRVAIDDFGTGYSSLAYLESLPVDIIKIDMSFVQRITESHKVLAIVETMIELARKLGIKTIAEGVETQEQFRLLKLLGCDYVQGFLFARPMSEEEIKKFCKNSHGNGL